MTQPTYKNEDVHALLGKIFAAKSLRDSTIYRDEVKAIFDAADKLKPKPAKFYAISEELVKFLCGEIAIDGRWFGDEFDGPRWWWRNTLLNKLPAIEATKPKWNMPPATDFRLSQGINGQQVVYLQGDFSMLLYEYNNIRDKIMEMNK
jgi:hypothetical protein